MSAMDTDFEQLGKEHQDRQERKKRAYTKRGVPLKALHVELYVQNHVNLKAIADAEEMTMGQVLDRLISREVAKRRKQLELSAQNVPAG